MSTAKTDVNEKRAKKRRASEAKLQTPATGPGQQSSNPIMPVFYFSTIGRFLMRYLSEGPAGF